ncbi:hormogonium polysaccharide biosynthesis protein HpsA [Dapis sp. BLCC M172]|uniref:hormogonium polysaccharide biosynthesis protein HpsA n=1 Tax=Dapis sp. BLCC M172 TaxID=2975281 RepID=UPI003CF927D4
MYYHNIKKNIKTIVINISKQSKLLIRGLVKFTARRKTTLGKATNAGFVLPTVTMVMLVVVLLTVAILLRSFDRAEQARNVRVSEQALSAATPALDRARAKIQYLLQEDPTLPRETPSDDVLYSTLSSITPDRYTFADENRLSVTYDLDGSNSIENEGNNASQIEDDEEVRTAWRFPVDTNNNGIADSYTIYGIFFRTPPRNGTGFTRERGPLEARTPPMPPLGVLQNQNCAGALGSSASLVGDSGWYKADGKLVKSFFVYTVTVPITEPGNDEEAFPGTTGVAALEYQEDWERIPLTNNAVLYGDDLEISPGPDFRINGRILTNSNLVVSPFRNDLHIYQVSSNSSCFYEAENSKIIVGGNVVNGMSGNSNQTNDVDVDLFQGTGNAVVTDVINTGQDSVNNTSFETIYNNDAYERRIAHLLNNIPAGCEPSEVTDRVTDRVEEEGADTDREAEIRREEYEIYFRDRTIKVPFINVNAGTNETLTETPTCEVIDGNNHIVPPDAWRLPTETNTKLDLDENQLEAQEPNGEDNRLEQLLGDRIFVGNNLPAKQWDGSTFVRGEQDAGEWTDTEATRTRLARVTELPSVGSSDRNGFWERAAAEVPEASLDGIGGLRIVTGAGVYERTNSFLPPPVTGNNPPTTPLNEVPFDDPATNDVEQYTVVWPDTMPMSSSPVATVYDNDNQQWDPNPLPNAADTANWPLRNTGTYAAVTPTIDPNTPKYAKGDLRMRATVLYHYASDPIDPDADPVDNEQEPIACISSYYDPTNSTTAANLTSLPDTGFGATANGKSNNGVVYEPPTDTFRPTSSSLGTNGRFTTNPPELGDQASMVFPDGRFANEPLRRALERLDGGTTNDLTLEEQAAIDSTLCSLDILNGNVNRTNAPFGVDYDGVIREVTLLDARQIKAIDADNLDTTDVDETFTLNSTLANPANLTTNYDQFIEERQPLEIRLTQLDLGAMRNLEITTFGAAIPTEVSTGLGEEYLLPYSGIIYATRDDALPDRSDRTPNDDNSAIDEDSSALISPTDYRLDPTRRPNGIMLINGERLARNDNDDDGQNDDADPVSSVEDVVKEKGLTLVSNLPVYIQGTFNPHTEQEFNENLQDDWGNFYTRTDINQNFACRPGDPRISGCTTGDQWRPATVLADAITVLSDNDSDLGLGFRSGFRDEGDFDLRNNAGNLPVVMDDFNTDGTLDRGYNFNRSVDNQTTDNTTDDLVNEAELGFDLDGRDSNGDGDKENDTVLEADITVAGARMLNGFYGNNFVTNGLSSGAYFTDATPQINTVSYDGAGNQIDNSGNAVTPTDIITDANYSTNNSNTVVNSSYFNNYVTPVQRRGDFPEYVMEICRKLPVSSCQPPDWVVDIGANETANQVAVGTSVNALGAGTTARPALDPNDRRYPRRVAFARDSSNNLILDGGLPIPIGVQSGDLQLFSYNTSPATITGTGTNFDTQTPINNIPDIAANALWFRTSNNATDPTQGANYGNTFPLAYLNSLVVPDPIGAPTEGTVQQPLLVPVLQYNAPGTAPPGTSGNLPTGNNDQLTNRGWLQRAAGDTIFNLVVGSGDVPPRTGNNGEGNGGLQNLPRFLENWLRNNGQDNQITGGFMQLKRSAYATAPYTHISPNPINPDPGESRFGPPYNTYNLNNGGGRIPFFLPPNRNWGFDVGLLSQSPDYFSQQLSGQSSSAEPDRYYREVSQDDDWIQTLLCSTLVDGGGNAVNAQNRPDDFCEDFTE